MISELNYYDTVRPLDLNQWPDDLRRGHNMVDALTLQGKNWSSAKNNPTLFQALQMYFQQLDKFLTGKRTQAPVPTPAIKKELPIAPPVETKPKVIPVKKEPPVKKESVKQGKGGSSGGGGKSKGRKSGTEKVELISDEIKLLKRFYNMVGKTRTREQLLNYIKALQKAIAERRIRKVSPHADAFREIQKSLVDFYNNTRKQSWEVEASNKLLSHLEKNVDSQEVIVSIPFIKRFIAMHGKEDIEDKAEKLRQSIDNAVTKGKIPYNDKYIDTLIDITGRLEQYLKRPSQRMEIPPAELNGLQGIIEGCSCEDEPESEEEDEPRIVNSLEFVKQEFDTIGLRGKWLDFIGDPSPGFTAMVFGKPKMGKSYLCIDFAGYLAQHHGKVLYVAREEKLHDTLKRKLVEMNVPHTNLDVVAGLPSDLSPYQFIFIDSVNKLGLKPAQLEELEERYPDKSFIYVFQTVKTGAFRGDNAFQHHVDVVVEVPQKGKAVQYGRFNQGGELNIFENKMAA